jgi:putative ABC transport system substrate-binding protein
MRRREFIAVVGSAAISPILQPFAARAQQPAMPVVGVLCGGTPESDAFRLNAFRQGLTEASYVENRNVVLEYRVRSR